MAALSISDVSTRSSDELDTMTTRVPSRVQSEANTVVGGDEEELEAARAASAAMGITYYPTGKKVLSNASQWEPTIFSSLKASELLSRLRICSCIDTERMEMFRCIFVEEKDDYEGYVAYLRNRLAAQPRNYTQTMPIMQSLVDEMEEDLREAQDSLDTVIRIAADVHVRTLELTKEYEQLDDELVQFVEREAAEPEQTENGQDENEESAEAAEGKARKALICDAVAAKEKEQRKQLRIIFTEHRRLELVEYGASVFPLSLNTVATLWGEPATVPPPPLPTPVSPASPPEQQTPRIRIEESAAAFASLQASADIHSSQLQQFLLPEGEMEVPAPAAGSQLQLWITQMENTGIINESHETVRSFDSREASCGTEDSRRGRSLRSRYGPSGRNSTEAVCHGDPSFTYSVYDGSPSRLSDFSDDLDQATILACQLLRYTPVPVGARSVSSPPALSRSREARP
ncbi:hypothetical protein, conserved [Eimeria necatrix]|uniref:Uncharacterized protein n=1 Tax=Eimeria necatrix TaxID=51315 RepID=U6MQY0_9EIME|nr:hypothetical protein, conserved [Eimeria necatrix]CDJ65503.1 hypothetical protein, conserved [Eimeria necatrix]